MIVSFRLPRVSLGAVSNLVGMLGLIAVAVAVGGLTGNWWWSALIGGLEALGVAYMSGLEAERQRAEKAEQEAAAGPRPVAVKAS